MQNAAIMNNGANLNTELYSVQITQENEKEASYQFDKILKNVQSKPENAKSFNKKNAHIDEDEIRSVNNENNLETEQIAANWTAESTSFLKISNTAQLNQTQSVALTTSILSEPTLPLQLPKGLPSSISTQNNQRILAVSTENIQEYPEPADSITEEPVSSMYFHSAQKKLSEGSNESNFVPDKRCMLLEVKQQDKTQALMQTTNTVQEGNKISFLFSGRAIQINHISLPKNETVSITSTSEANLVPDVVAQETSLLNAKTIFPISVKPIFQQTNHDFSNEIVADPEALLLHDTDDSDVLSSVRNTIAYHDILSPAKLTETASGTARAPLNIDPQNIVNQIVDQARLTNSAQNSEMVIKLKPEHLGELTLKVAVNNGLVTATFHSNNSDVRSVLEASIVQLKQEMVNNGIKVNYVGVYAGLDQFFSGGQHGNSGQHLHSSYWRNVDDEPIKEVEAWNAIQITDTQSNGVDYRI